MFLSWSSCHLCCCLFLVKKMFDLLFLKWRDSRRNGQMWHVFVLFSFIHGDRRKTFHVLKKILNTRTSNVNERDECCRPSFPRRRTCHQRKVTLSSSMKIPSKPDSSLHAFLSHLLEFQVQAKRQCTLFKLEFLWKSLNMQADSSSRCFFRIHWG